ncbi:glycoside hydrolase family 5 protein [Cadophora sp. DSE1049]|nr:glycoside hydrolase family 5 protein [Cadophora sp. DSE1049]
MATGILKVKGVDVVDANGKRVILRGAGLGGWLNMENFITGYPGHESRHRAAMLTVLGKEKYDSFFDRWLGYFFTEADAKYFASLGLNCIRIPFNYRHLEDDMNPRVLKGGGFKHLDRVIDLCAKEGIYTILDMHTLPGGQSPGWHSDNPTAYSAFWDYKDHQDRTVWLWEQISARYKGNPWIAGYNPINEPCDSEYTRLPAYYKRLEKAIRLVDPDHILWLDGNSFAKEFKGFDEVLPNCVYSIHDYSRMGFPTGEKWESTERQKKILLSQYEEKCAWQKSVKAPIWNGEFGPVYANPKYEPDAERTNELRSDLLGEQLKIYDKEQIPWTIWLYKDIGLQGMVHTSPDSAWNRLLQGFLEKKKRLQLDSWGKYPNEEAEIVMNPLFDWIRKVSPTAEFQYPPIYTLQKHVSRAVLETFLADSLQVEFAELFRGKSEEELDELARSFHFDNCLQRGPLNKVLSEHATIVGS